MSSRRQITAVAVWAKKQSIPHGPLLLSGHLCLATGHSSPDLGLGHVPCFRSPKQLQRLPCTCLRLHYCSSCVASEENYNCLERQETGCAWPASSQTYPHIRWQPESPGLLYRNWRHSQRSHPTKPCTASLWPAPGMCHSSSAQGHCVPWGLWAHGTPPHG